MSIKCKGSKLQCTNKRKFGLYCGKHSKCKNIINIKDIIGLNNNKIINNNSTTMDKGNELINIKNINLLKKNVLNNNCGSYKVFYIRQMIKYHNLPINTKQSKLELITKLKNYFNKNNHYENNIDKIIIIQKNIRKRIIYRISNCVNNEDLLTLDTLYKIPLKYFIKIQDINDKYYGFDIRTLNEIHKNGGNQNPYTQNKISTEEWYKIIKHINYLEHNGLEYNIKKDIIDPEKEMELRMVEIFHEIDLLDNYTDHIWFKDLNLNQLKKLYRFTEDIWNYRTDLNLEEKKKILQDGVAFNIPIYQINRIKHKINLQKIILNEYERFIYEGQSRDDKKLGVMLLLTGLVEVSEPAAYALPHLIQVF